MKTQFKNYSSNILVCNIVWLLYVTNNLCSTKLPLIQAPHTKCNGIDVKEKERRVSIDGHTDTLNDNAILATI